MSQPWTGNKQHIEQGLPVSPNSAYWLMHHPETCWEFIEHDGKYLFLPTFRKLYELAGCNGVRMIPRGGADSQMARVSMMDNGFHILDMDMGYQQRFRTLSGGYFYTDIWTSPKVIGKRVVWKFDNHAYNVWRNELITAEILEPIDEDIVSLILDVKKQRVERNAPRTHIPAIKEKFEEESKVLDFMLQFHRKMQPIPVLKEPKKRTRKSV